jgi:hypothetical protein
MKITLIQMLKAQSKFEFNYGKKSRKTNFT